MESRFLHRCVMRLNELSMNAQWLLTLIQSVLTFCECVCVLSVSNAFCYRKLACLHKSVCFHWLCDLWAFEAGKQRALSVWELWGCVVTLSLFSGLWERLHQLQLFNCHTHIYLLPENRLMFLKQRRSLLYGHVRRCNKMKSSLFLSLVLFSRFWLGRHDERGVSCAAGEHLLRWARAERGLRFDARGWHHWGGGSRWWCQHRKWPQRSCCALPRAGSCGLLLPQADYLSSQLVHPHGLQPISFTPWPLTFDLFSITSPALFFGIFFIPLASFCRVTILSFFFLSVLF